jgi:hypothetical protein
VIAARESQICNNFGDVSVKKVVDVHSHFLPDIYQPALEKLVKTWPDGIASLPKWSPKEALATMDRLGVETAFLSISSPGVHFWR